MLDDIRLHLDADEALQSEHEKYCAELIERRLRQNKQAFKQYMPLLAAELDELHNKRLSIFVNRLKQINVVDYQQGRVLYPLDVKKNLDTQVEQLAYHSAYLQLCSEQGIAEARFLQNYKPQIKKNDKEQVPSDLESDLEGDLESDLEGDLERDFKYSQDLQQHLSSQNIDALILLGLGTGEIINCLLEKANFKHLVIYEQDYEMLACSLASFDWKHLFEYAEQNGIGLFLQIGNKLTTLKSDLEELNQALSIQHFLFFQHCYHPSYANIVANLRNNVWSKAILERPNPDCEGHISAPLSYFSSADFSNIAREKPDRLRRNLAAFKNRIPDLYEAFKNYQVKCWHCFEVQSGKYSQGIASDEASSESNINVINMQTRETYSNLSPKSDGIGLAEHFFDYPNVDGLVFGYSGDKLAHYAHNRFIRKIDQITSKERTCKAKLPNCIPSLLVLGLGDGYALEHICEQRDVQNLIISEPNPDLFYASLHAIDWEQIFQQVDEKQGRLYLNIGEGSSQLFKDLMNQFLTLGPHILNDTYLFRAYENPELHQVITEVRQQLKVIFSLGENFDHVLYGLSHTCKALHAGIPSMRFEAYQYLQKTDKQVPIFVVGNGPSLDNNIELIKECEGEVVVVSCGTALQALHRNGIVPDFHGEVEQNRANFDWASRINDPAYLKKITLISVNGIHPDTCKLYKDVLTAFKVGESSTAATLSVLPKQSFQQIEDAYPTVTNMVVSFFLNLGFEQLYLIGVDLGFADQNKHHSKHSGYYEQGQQLFDYKKAHATDMRVRGNRRDYVFTKTEFNISRMVLEHTLARFSAEVFNLSDGVFIEGTLPLDSENVLVTSNKQNKTLMLEHFSECFMSLKSDIYHLMSKAFSNQLMQRQIDCLTEIVESAYKAIEAHKTEQSKLNKKPIENNSDQSDDLTLDTKSKTTIVNEENRLSVLIRDLVDELQNHILTNKQEPGSLYPLYFFNSVQYLCAGLSKAKMQEDQNLVLQDCESIVSQWNLFLSDAKALLLEQFDIIDASQAFSQKRETLRLACENQALYQRPVCGNASRRVAFFTSDEALYASLNDEDLVNHFGMHLNLTKKKTSWVKDFVQADSIDKLLVHIEQGALAEEIVYPIMDLPEQIGGLPESNTIRKWQSIAFVVHDMKAFTAVKSALLKHQKRWFDIGINKLPSILFIPPCLSILGHAERELATNGLLSFLPPRVFVHQLCARAQDIDCFHFIFVKGYFCKTGKINARQSTTRDKLAHLSQAEQVMHESFVSKMTLNEHIMFRHYLALSDQSLTQSSYVDALGNRGARVTRAPLPEELISDWFDFELNTTV